MAQTDLTIQIDDELKASGEALFQKLGTSFSVVINAIVRQAVENGKIPFEIEPEGFEYSQELEADDPYFDREMQAELHRTVKEAEAGQFIKFDPFKESIDVARARLNG